MKYINIILLFADSNKWFIETWITYSPVSRPFMYFYKRTISLHKQICAIKSHEAANRKGW